MISTAQEMKFSTKDLFGKCDQIRSFLRIWSHFLKKSLVENFISSALFVDSRATILTKSGTLRFQKDYWVFIELFLFSY